MEFKLDKEDASTSARATTLTTAHGVIETPIFMPVGTLGAVKGLHFRDVSQDAMAQIILSNTYHLYLRPGLEVLRAAGGLHKFGGWNGPILTDSGGFQVFSLAENRKLTPEGVTFSSHIDGSKHLFTPESVVDAQRIIGSDVMMALDECPPGQSERDYATKSLDLTESWLKRGIARFDETAPLYGHPQAFFPIVQGAAYPDLRRRAAENAANYNREGYAIGGLAVGEPTETMYEMVDLVCGILPRDRPRYLMGVGTPVNILENIALGVDMFDCVMPTRNGRTGMIFTSQGIINLKNEKWKLDFSPLDPDGTSFVDRTYTKAFVRHLFNVNEMLGAIVASEHNITFYLHLVGQARKHILAGDFRQWKDDTIKQLSNRI